MRTHTAGTTGNRKHKQSASYFLSSSDTHKGGPVILLAAQEVCVESKAKEGTKMKRVAARDAKVKDAHTAALGRSKKAKGTECEVSRIFGETIVIDNHGKIVDASQVPSNLRSPSY